MNDRRLTPATPRVAHVSLRGKIASPCFVEGQSAIVVQPVVDLLPEPDVNFGRMDRQLLFGESVTLLEDYKDHRFVMSEKDGYVGWVRARDVDDATPAKPTHVVCQRSTHLYTFPDMKQTRHVREFSLGSRFEVIGQTGSFARISLPNQSGGGFVGLDGFDHRFVPMQHIRALSAPEADPVAVAERLIGTPYLWGGNSAFGVDCSGLVQIACQMCGVLCPGDSDLQQNHFPAAPDDLYHRGDLLFWQGHVAMVSDPETVLHANAHHMAVAYEPLADAVARIETQGGGQVVKHARLT